MIINTFTLQDIRLLIYHAMKEKSARNSGVKDIKPSHLMGGNLALVASRCMLRDADQRQKFLEIIEREKTRYASLQNAYLHRFGYMPSSECVELARIAEAYDKFYDSISDIWSLGDGLRGFGVKTKPCNVDWYINDWHFIMTILTGLELIGSEGSGDRCFLSTLPNPLGTTEIYLYDHEVGKIEDRLGYSIAHFVADRWASEEYESIEDDGNKKDLDTGIVPKKTFNDFTKKARQRLKKRPYYHDPVVLFRRTHWLSGHALGSPTYKSAYKMADAPPYAVWEKEIDLVAKEPVLANYWMLAHYFLGNNKACRATIEEAKKAPGEVSPKLAVIIEKLLDDPKKAKLGQLKPSQLNRLKLDTRKNSLAELLEPENQEAYSKAGAIKKLPRVEYKKKISSEDPWKLINEYPRDVDLHDAVLKSVLKKDRKLGEVIDEYFNARSRDARSEWPYTVTAGHRNLLRPIVAAFQSGLQYDADHVKAFSGLTNVLGKLDGDLSMEAYAEAMRTLNPDDERLDYVIANLSKSKHLRAKEIMRIGAWRFFDQFSRMVKSIKRTEAEGPTLNNMFQVHSYLHYALNFALNYSDEEAEKLADTVLNFRSNLRALGGSIGRALRVVGNRKLVRYAGYAKWYCTATSELKNDDLEKNGSYNFAEAAIAYTKLAPKEAKKVLKKIFDKKYSSKFYMLDMKAGALAGLLVLEPKNHEFLEWATRILGNRSENMRAYGPLRAIDEARIQALAPLAKPHVYGDPNPVDEYSFFIRGAALKAVESATGVTLPLFNDEDEYASNVKKKNLPQAIKQTEKYLTANVFERIIEDNYKHPDVIKNGVEFLIETLRFSGDEQDQGGTQGIWNAIKALVIQGPASLPGLAKVLELPYANREWYGNILLSMRIVEPETQVVSWLLQNTPTKINKQLEKPEPRFMPWLDLIAAFAFAQQGDRARTPIEKALAFRYQYTSDEHSHGWEEMEPTLTRLPRIYAQFGETARPLLTKLLAQKNHTEYPKEFLQDGLKRMKQLIDVKSVAKKIGVNGKISLSENTEQIGTDRPIYSISIKVESKKLTCHCKIEQLYFQDMVENDTLENKIAMVFSSAEEAQVKASLLLETYVILGYKARKTK